MVAAVSSLPPPPVRRRRRDSTPATGRLTASERAELEYLWHQYDSDLGARSVHGAIEDRLRRSSPKALAGPIVDLVRIAGGRTQLRLLVSALKREEDATRHEVVGAIGGLVKAKRVAIEGGSERALDWLAGDDDPIDHLGNAADRTALEGVYVRLLLSVARTVMTREERWRAQDEAIEREWRRLECGEDESHAVELRAGGGRKAHVAVGALAQVGRGHARVLRAVYGPRSPAARYDVFGELAPLVEWTATVKEMRQERVTRRVAELAAGRVLGQLGVTAMQVTRVEWAPYQRQAAAEWPASRLVREVLDGAGRSLLERTRRSMFVAKVKSETRAMAVAADEAYREARGR